MRILLTSDLHYKLRQYDWLIGAAAGFDAIVIAGDHIDAFLPVPGAVQIAALSASLPRWRRRAGCSCAPAITISTRGTTRARRRPTGLPPCAAPRSPSMAIRSTIGDTLFTVCPWWDGPHARADVEQMLETASQQRTGRWVWVYHAPPEGF